MAHLTIRNIPDGILEKIRHMANLERRSLNSEILMIIERGTEQELVEINRRRKNISPSKQVHFWKNLSSKWEDERSTEEIVEDIYRSRTFGRNFEL